MKPLVKCLFALVFSLMIKGVYAQDSPSNTTKKISQFGIQLSALSPFMYGNEYKAKLGYGYSTSLVYQASISVHIKLNSELGFSQEYARMQSTLNFPNEQRILNLKSASNYVHARILLEPTVFRKFTFLAGIQYDLLLLASNKVINVTIDDYEYTSKSKDFYLEYYNRNNFSAITGLGLEISEKCNLRVLYLHGLNDVILSPTVDGSLYPNIYRIDKRSNLSLSATYSFGKK
jgi:hypothetical protein